MAERDSERAMREATPPRKRHATPTGGDGHPFAGGAIALDIEWDGTKRLRTSMHNRRVPTQLTDHDMSRIWDLGDQIRLIVYRAQWRAAHPDPNPDPDAAPGRHSSED
jgi:hypothetical protein